jgi:hypothetical protein
VIRLLAAALLSVLLLPSVLAGGKKPEGLSVNFHLQGNRDDGPNRVFAQLTAGQEIYYQLAPAFSSKDFTSFVPFPADDGASYGVLVKLNAGAATRLTSITADNRGQYLLAIVNGQVRDAVLIDRAVDDGVLVIWQRISIAEVRQADAAMPRIGQDTKEWKKNLKKKK